MSLLANTPALQLLGGVLLVADGPLKANRLALQGARRALLGVAAALLKALKVGAARLKARL